MLYTLVAITMLKGLIFTVVLDTQMSASDCAEIMDVGVADLVMYTKEGETIELDESITPLACIVEQ